MKPTELYDYDKLRREGQEVSVTSIRRIRPELDVYKREGAERYILTFEGEAFSSSTSAWSDEDLPDTEWSDDQDYKE